MYDKKYYDLHRKQLLANHEKWRKANKVKIAAQRKIRYHSDPAYKEIRLRRTREYLKLKYRTDPEFRKMRALQQLKLKYNLTSDDMHNLLKKQNNKCAICQKKTKLVVDHDHKTGKVRGLLCKKCNMWLSWFDSKKKFETILKYLGR